MNLQLRRMFEKKKKAFESKFSEGQIGNSSDLAQINIQISKKEKENWYNTAHMKDLTLRLTNTLLCEAGNPAALWY